MEKVIRHKSFELGQAPYRYQFTWSSPSKSILEANPSAYNGAMASRPRCCQHACQHCGMALIHHAVITDATGKQFAIGHDCLGKISDVEHLPKAEADRKDRQRILRRNKAEEKRELQRLVRENDLQVQRDKNGGLTDYEVQQEAAKAERQERTTHNIEVAGDWIHTLRGMDGYFCGSIADDLARGRMPVGRGATILKEIIAKTAGRKNSKAYEAKMVEVEVDFENIKNNLRAV